MSTTLKPGTEKACEVAPDARDIDWVGLFDPDQRMTIRDRGELRDLFARALRRMRAETVEECAKEMDALERDHKRLKQSEACESASLGARCIRALGTP